MGLEVIERLCFLASLPFAGTGQRERGRFRVAIPHWYPNLIHKEILINKA